MKAGSQLGSCGHAISAASHEQHQGDGFGFAGDMWCEIAQLRCAISIAAERPKPENSHIHNLLPTGRLQVIG